MDSRKNVTVLYLGSLEHSEEVFVGDKKSQDDEIDFGKPTKICLLRIPRPKRDMYSRCLSITQVLFYLNLERANKTIVDLLQKPRINKRKVLLIKLEQWVDGHINRWHTDNPQRARNDFIYADIHRFNSDSRYFHQNYSLHLWQCHRGWISTKVEMPIFRSRLSNKASLNLFIHVFINFIVDHVIFLKKRVSMSEQLSES